MAGLVAAPTEQPSSDRAQRTGEMDTWLSSNLLRPVAVEEPEATTGLTLSPNIGSGYSQIAVIARLLAGSGWVPFGDLQSRVILIQDPDDIAVLGAPDRSDFTPSPSAPIFTRLVGTGEMVDEIRDAVQEAWHRYTATTAPFVTTAPLTLLDVPSALREARSRAGLPVQDLAAMFGVKRRHFYNLLAGGGDETERMPRIAQVTSAIAQVSDWAGHNSRKARTLLLTRLAGDSIYDAAVADDEGRLGAALERAHAAAVESAALPSRLAPSYRATPAEATAGREFLRSTRDDTGAANER
jgi:hypothetical protein